MKMPSFDRTPRPDSPSVAARVERLSIKMHLAALALGAMEACSAQNAQIRGAVSQSLEQAAQRPDRPDVINMAIRVAERTQAMEGVRPETINVIAQSVEAHHNPALARGLRRMEGARAIGRELMTPGSHVEGLESSREAASDQSRPVTSVEAADVAFGNVFVYRAEGESAGSDRVDLAFAVTNAYLDRQVDQAQTRLVLRSGLLAADNAAYAGLAREIPNAQVDLTRTFSSIELSLFAAYADHLNSVGYWEGRQALTGAQVLSGHIPLSQGAALFGSVSATGGLSRWDGMNWAGARTQDQQSECRALNVDLGLKLSEAMALFAHDIEWANGNQPGYRRQVFTPGDTAPLVAQRGYSAWNVVPQTIPLHAPPIHFASNDYQGGRQGHRGDR